MEDLRATLDHINLAWREGRFEELGEHFDADIVMKGPGLSELGRGRDSLVKSYEVFMASSKVLEYAESNHKFHEWRDTGIAAYEWSMKWEQAGKINTQAGQDMFVFERRDGRWVAVMRLMLF